MTGSLAFARGCFALAVLLATTAGAEEIDQDEDVYSKSSTCEAFDTSRDVTDYSARLVAHHGARASYEIQIQAMHAKRMASPIRKITLSDGSTPDFNMLKDNCICGMRINDVEVECTHITSYSVDVARETLEASVESGLAMTFLLDNGRIVAGPRFGPDEINETLMRS